MKILKNRTYQKLLSNLEAKEKADKTWQEMYKSVSVAKQNAEVKLAEKEQECKRILEKLNRTEERLKLATDPPQEVSLQTRSISSKKSAKK